MSRILCAFVFISAPLFGQIDITGSVTSPKKEPVAGVQIFVQGTPIRASCDSNGSFHLSLSADSAYLIFALVGYQSKIVRVKGDENIKVILRPIVQSATWEFHYVDGPWPTREDNTGTYTIYYTDTTILPTRLNSKKVVWEIDQYKIYLPYDSLVLELEYQGYNLQEFTKKYLRGVSNDVLALQKELSDKIKNELMSELATRMIKMKSIFITGKNGKTVPFLFAKSVEWKSKATYPPLNIHSTWNGYEFWVKDGKKPLFNKILGSS